MDSMPTDHARTPLRDTTLSAEGLSIAHSRDGATHTLHLAGELDMTAASDVLAAVALVVQDAREVVLDLSDLSFIDSAGLHLILRIRDLCRHFGCRFLIDSPNEQAQRLLELTGLITPLREEGLLID